jgi:hypothetical protein
VAEFDGAGGEGEQPFGGESLQHRFHVLGLGRALALGQLGPGGAVCGVGAFGAGRRKAGEDLPGRGLLGQGEVFVGALGAGGDRSCDATGPLVVGECDSCLGPAPPGLVQGVREQRQRSRPGGSRLAVTHLGEQDADQVFVHLRAGLLGRLGDRDPQLALGHRRHQVAVLDRIGQLGVIRAAGFEV